MIMDQFKSKFFESHKISKSIIVISAILLLTSFLFKIYMINYDNNLNKLIDEVSSIKLSLVTIEKFDELFPGKWKHYLNDEPTIISIRDDLNELGLVNVSIKDGEGIMNLEGQTKNISNITNMINFFYNSRGLVIKRLSIDTISNDLIVYNISFDY